ncbi:GntR family transcriptional regulator [Bacillus sp. DTU_2020_1000418_1_SI_GHA_SEK_038]|uniref:GntR family transcriptional regulator n=1 Tax=Bacillus sp. DTU_2020_1000418_1_SI_GHA_SEK_038 TaxID=3077585 RepID=UPI0028E4DA5C|nr:GntR family transcriptional regulator [Bacillus sp. DTU_2020_1000418_1_SI_GHA_SEK_038]WNS75055.1 GntR family transcriptional regulator [Bacillus sp. DTU_2020_1000418_1_SI_GHA_SEK_038]
MPIPANYSTPTRMSAKKRAFSQILEWIIDGTLHPKEKLHDADLAQALGVSRTPIREALQLLSFQGFVEMYPGVGTQVTSVNKEDISKILPPLGVLQALATELATPIISQEQIKSLRELNNQFAEAVITGDSYTALKLDEEFHQSIVDVTENSYISSTVSTLQSHVRRLYFHNSIILTPKSIEEHEAILKALEEKNKEEAARIARMNVVHAIDIFYEKQETEKNNEES